MTVTLTIEELETLFQAALEGQAALRTDIDSMQSDPDVERHEISHFRSKLYRTKAILDEVEKRMIFADKREVKNSPKQGDFSAWEKFPGGF